MQKFIIEYQVGDGCTVSSPEIKAVEAESKEAFLCALENCLITYNPSPASCTEHFRCGGQLFEFKDHVYHLDTRDGYEYNLPDVYTFEEWAEKSFKSNESVLNYHLTSLKNKLSIEQYLNNLSANEERKERIEELKQSIAHLEGAD